MRSATENFWDTLPREVADELKDGLDPFRGALWALVFNAVLAIMALIWIVAR